MKVTITRAQNGWILAEDRPFAFAEGTYLAQEVFEDEEHESEIYTQACSLASVLWSAFPTYFQSKWQPGITLDVSAKGREDEFMEEYERQRAEEQEEMLERYHDFGEPFELPDTLDDSETD